MRGLLAALAAVADWALTGATSSAPRACNRCARIVTRLTPGQWDALARLEKPVCRRRGCGGELWPATAHGTDRLINDLNDDDAPGSQPGAPCNRKTYGWKEPKDMTTIIRRRAHDVHAGDVIVSDPDHPDRVVRWRAQQPARRNADGVTLIECRDLADGKPVLAVFPSMTEVAVEPAGVR